MEKSKERRPSKNVQSLIQTASIEFTASHLSVHTKLAKVGTKRLLSWV